MQSSVASLRKPSGETDDRRGVDEDLGGLLDALADQDCRRILRTLQVEGNALTALGVSEECGIPLSTVYRKLQDLQEANLVRESTEMRTNGKHTNSYEPGFDEVAVSVSQDGFDATMIQRE